MKRIPSFMRKIIHKTPRFKNPVANLWNVKIVAPTNHDDGEPRVIINGHDITERLSGVTYELNAGKMPKVTLTFIPRKITISSLATAQVYDVDLSSFSDFESKLRASL